MVQKPLLIFLLFASLLKAQTEQQYLNEAEKNTIQDFVWDWCDACDKWNLEQLGKVYGDNVLFYGKELPKEKCLAKISAAYNPNEVFRQEIISPIRLTAYASGIVKADFIKRVVRNDLAKHYPSYLLVKHNGSKYEVVGESDRVTDDKLNYKLDLGPELGSESNELVSKETSFAWLWAVLVVLIIAAVFIFRKRKRIKRNP